MCDVSSNFIQEQALWSEKRAVLSQASSPNKYHIGP
jgi:hypothetical protein